MARVVLKTVLRALLSVAIAVPAGVAVADVEEAESVQIAGLAGSGDGGETPRTRHAIAPDVRDDETKLTIQNGDFVVAPIPISDPVLGSGLVLASAYFYPQTEEQKATQPASVTGVAGMYTSSESYAYAVGQQNYWGRDRWRFNGLLGHADLKLELRSGDESAEGRRTDWLLDGDFLQTGISRMIAGDWYLGLTGRLVDIKQSFEVDRESDGFDFGPGIRIVGVGLSLEHDSRDLPLNSYSGQLFELRGLFNDSALGSDSTYQAYNAALRSYHRLSERVVLAWELEACKKTGSVPLWDACRIGLRGFPATDYLGRLSGSAQVELRWNFWKRWGLVGFAGGGAVDDSLIEKDDGDLIPSAGVGLRFMLLKSKRINFRLDYGRSDGEDAVYFSVGEAF
jgi:hypothetical protein